MDKKNCFSCDCKFIRTGSKNKAICVPCGIWWTRVVDFNESKDHDYDSLKMK